MISKQEQRPSIIRYFVDEAGDPMLFNRQGQLIIGNAGVTVQPPP